MKTLRLLLAFFVLVFVAAPTASPTPAPFNLSNVFGVPQPTPGPTAQPCIWSNTTNPMAANGTNSDTVSLTDANLTPLGPVSIQVDTGGGTFFFKSVQYPQTVVACAPTPCTVNPGTFWRVTVIPVAGANYSCQMTLTTQ